MPDLDGVLVKLGLVLQELHVLLRDLVFASTVSHISKLNLNEVRLSKGLKTVFRFLDMT